MTRRRLLLMCYFFPPLGGGGVHRALGFTRHLPDHGWDCTVVCAGAEDYWVTDDTLTAQVRPETEVLRVEGGSASGAWLRLRRRERGRRPGATFGVLRRLADWWLFPDAYAGWSRRATSVAMRRAAAGDVDVVMTSSPPDSVHMAGRAMRRRTGLPWVADFRDPWVGLHFRRPPTAWHERRHAALERAVLAEADLTLVASRTHLDSLGSRSGGRARAALHLPNGFEPGAVGAAAADPDRFTIVFTGTLSQMPDAGVFLEALDGLFRLAPEARRRVRARFVGPYESDVEDRTLALGLKGIVEFMGPRPHAEARALQRGADLLMLWKPRGYPTMVPGKLYEYLEAGRPILALLEAGDEAAALVGRAGGERVEPGDRDALVAALERRYRDWRAGGRAAAARPDWLDGHARPRLAARLAEELDRLAGGAR